MGAYELLIEKGYVNSADAAKILNMKSGGNIIEKLKTMGVECISFPTKTGDGTKSRWLCNEADIRAAMNPAIPGGTENGGKLSSRCRILEDRVDALERELVKLKRDLGA